MPFCIVTGSASGNGFAIAKSLKNDTHQVLGIDLKKPDTNNFDTFIIGDVSSKEIIEKAFNIFLESGENELYLVNNAGITKPSFPQNEKDWDKTIEINLKAPFLWSNYFLENVLRKKIKKGGILFIGSLATKMGFPQNPSYQASKCGLVGLTQSFAYDLGKYGIRVNCISPGYVKTNMTKKSYEDKSLNSARQKHMLIKRWGDPEDISNVISFFCSDKSSYITGTNITVDGGWSINGLTDN